LVDFVCICVCVCVMNECWYFVFTRYVSDSVDIRLAFVMILTRPYTYKNLTHKRTHIYSLSLSVCVCRVLVGVSGRKFLFLLRFSDVVCLLVLAYPPLLAPLLQSALDDVNVGSLGIKISPLWV
jgi:hypothetical protein